MGTNAESRVLALLGGRVRAGREARGWTRNALARRSGVSERFLAEVEAGRGNISVAKLAAIAGALSVPLADLLDERGARDGSRGSPAFASGLDRALCRLATDELLEVERWVSGRFALESDRRILALLGLRGAGKSTVGAEVARRLSWPFIELDSLIEREAGLPLGELFALHGEGYYRRLELSALSRLVAGGSEAVLATGGGIVQSAEAFALLSRRCTTVWLKATARAHWGRVVRQGDARPMKGNPRARTELEDLLSAREPLYARAHFTVDTRLRGVPQVVRAVCALARPTGGGF
jgi:XRE family aerobic/anaerobic benzoate catabolism transcriptional regulator